MQKLQDKIETETRRLPEKNFTARNSLFTDMLELPHLRAMSSIFITVLISLSVNAAARDLLKKGRITLGFHHLPDGLTNFHMALFIWICMFVSTVAIYGAFLFWATVRVNFPVKPKPLKLKLWDTLCLVLFTAYCFCLPYFSISAIIENSLRPTMSKAVLMEMLRMLMKIYAFVRSNAPRVLNYKLHDEEKILCPEFLKFLYFSFAPTLIYRDNYPRTTHIRWNYVVLCFTEFAAVVLCMHLILEYIVVPSFKIDKIEELKWQQIFLILLENGIPWMFYLICMMYVILHAWQNAFAEMLRFADRLFYEDWWNSTSYARYHRTWNLIVQDWLYTYIYKDMYEIVLPKNKIAAKTTIFFISALVHELIYAFSFRFFYPIGFALFFIVGLPVSFLKLKNGVWASSLFLYTLTLGVGALSSSLLLEYYIRINCPVENVTLASYFTPRTFNFNCENKIG